MKDEAARRWEGPLDLRLQARDCPQPDPSQTGVPGLGVGGEKQERTGGVQAGRGGE